MTKKRNRVFPCYFFHLFHISWIVFFFLLQRIYLVNKNFATTRVKSCLTYLSTIPAKLEHSSLTTVLQSFTLCHIHNILSCLSLYDLDGPLVPRGSCHNKNHCYRKIYLARCALPRSKHSNNLTLKITECEIIIQRF